jgi:hypothetical protein
MQPDASAIGGPVNWINYKRRASSTYISCADTAATIGIELTHPDGTFFEHSGLRAMLEEPPAKPPGQRPNALEAAALGPHHRPAT